jgi:hypothetical protein
MDKESKKKDKSMKGENAMAVLAIPVDNKVILDGDKFQKQLNKKKDKQINEILERAEKINKQIEKGNK